MKVAPRALSRHLCWLFVFLALGAALLAADRGWLRPVSGDFGKIPGWSTNISPLESAPADFSLPAGPAGYRRAELSMTQLLHGLLFSKPSTGWRLAPEKTEVTSAWMDQQSGGTLKTIARANYLPTAYFSAGYISYSPALDPIGPVPNATTASGTWISTASGFRLWSDAANWSGGVIADGAGNSANFNALNITHDTFVSVDTSRTIGNVFIGDTDGTHRYLIGASAGSGLIFDSNALGVDAILQQSSTSAGDSIAAPITLLSALDVDNLSTAHELNLSGPILSGVRPGPPFPFFLSFNTVGSGNIRVDSNIFDGNGGKIGVAVFGGRVTLTAANSYREATLVNGGTLLINGDNTFATGMVHVNSGGTLGGTGTIGSTVFTDGGAITGADATSVGKLTLLGDLVLNTGVVDGTYLANLSGSLSDLLAITGTMFMGGQSELHIVGAADGITTYTLATFNAFNGMFDDSRVFGLPMGYDLVYNANSLQLVPIPEPSTWIGAALAFGAIAFVSRRRRRN